MSRDFNIKIFIPTPNIRASVNVPISKSEVNRLLILEALSNREIKLQNRSSANDAKVIERALADNKKEINIEDAGTAMRFLTAYFCAKNEHKILSGTERMHERPIGELVEALREIGFDVRFIEKENFPPLEILPINFDKLKNETTINGTISSQFISALMLIAAFLPKGLTITIKEGKTISESYIKLTASLLEKCGIEISFSENKITTPPKKQAKSSISAGGDWTNASYWYAFAALSKKAEITIPDLEQNTAQGDIAIAERGKLFGVKTVFGENKVVLKNEQEQSLFHETNELIFDFSNNPDLAQTIIVLCAGLNRKATFTGLQSLRIKETDRILALQQELKKVGYELLETEPEVFTLKGKFHAPTQAIKTYNDHRMAMAFAPLSVLVPMEIEDPNVVRKSYPEFWEEVKKLE